MLQALLQFWRAPGPIMLAAGADGEMLMARVRALIVALLLITPTYKVIVSPEYPVYFWGFWIVVFGAVEAAFVLAVLYWHEYRPWLGFTSSICDVTLVSLALMLFMLLDYPLVALNSKVTFEIYFLAITATSLRYDRRICVVAGIIALAQYAALNLYGNLHFDLSASPEAESVGSYSIIDQVTRLILMGAAVVLAYALIVRSGRLLRMSMFDSLTGIYNRACFNMFARKLLDGARRENSPLTVVMFDVDHFKQINDRFGHLVGDKVLIHIAHTLESRIRRLDVLARYGGEEFMLAMPGVGREEAIAVVARVRAAVTAEKTDLVPDMSITLSAGISFFPEDATDLPLLLDVADTRLLAAKRCGRDRAHAD